MANASLKGVEALRHTWQSNVQLQLNINSALDAIGFDDSYIEQAQIQNKRKYFKDAVWGMIQFDPRELFLINSPILQRLRNIKQLGFSYLTYPSAEHTRFPHSLGMAHVVKQFIKSIDEAYTYNANSGKNNTDTKISFSEFNSLHPLTKEELIFAGLLHDIGHLPFSHATESAIKNSNEFYIGEILLQDIVDETELHLGRSVSLSEILSILLVLSKRFETFYKKLFIGATNKNDCIESIQRISALIVGICPTENCVNIQQIISSADVDSDKIDYIARDSHSCGISSGVDVSRVFLGGGLISAPLSKIDTASDSDEQKLAFIINSSGSDTIDEISKARSSLYQRVYLHPATRSAEATLATALRRCSSVKDTKFPNLNDALHIWRMGDQELLKELENNILPDVADLGRRLSHRTLPKKACAVAPSLCEMQAHLPGIFLGMSQERAKRIKKDNTNSFIEKLSIGNSRDQSVIDQLEDLVEKYSDKLRVLFEQNSIFSSKYLSELDDDKNVNFISVATVDGKKHEALILVNGEIIPASEITNIHGQVDAFDIFKAIGFIISSECNRYITFLASIKAINALSVSSQPHLVKHNISEVLHDQVDQSIAFQRQAILDFDRVVRRSGLNRETAITMAGDAAKLGFFDDAPSIWKTDREFDKDIKEIATKYGRFDGENGWHISDSSIRGFINQFPPNLRSELVAALKSGTFIGQKDAADLVIQAISKINFSGSEKPIVAPLSFSSSGFVMSSAEAALAKIGIDLCQNLEDALERTPSRPIILVDDNAASGVQSARQIYAYFDTPSNLIPSIVAKDTTETPKLSERGRELLKKREFAIAVCLGSKTAETLLNGAVSITKIENYKGLFFGDEIGSKIIWPNRLKDFLNDVGRNLISNEHYTRNYKDISDKDKLKFIDGRAFGYGNVGGLTILPHNVPSSTATAFWMPGRYNGRPWIPLFLRRGRFSNLLLG